jgi:thimet oligopeptidase
MNLSPQIISTFVVLGVLIISLLCIKNYTFNFNKKVPTSIRTEADIPALFPKKVKEIEWRVQQAILEAQKIVDTIIDIPSEYRTFENTAKAIDHLESLSSLAITGNILATLRHVSPDKSIRDACQNAILRISQFSLEHITNNKALYQALKEYAQGNAHKEALSDEERYFITKTLQDYKRIGLDLPDEQLKKVREIEQELTELSLKYDENIASDNRSIEVKQSDLEGMDPDFIKHLKKNSKGLYLVGTDYPTYTAVMQHCSVESTRKSLYKLFVNRGYPANEAILSATICKRDELAHMLGFASYAHLNLDDTMIKHPERAKEFIMTLLDKATPKEQADYVKLTADLPPSVSLDSDGRIKPWDNAYIKAWYEKKHYNIDDRTIAEYFPMEHTIKGLIDIYARFFNLTFKTIPISNLWDNNVMLMGVIDNHKQLLLGYLLLDLYPRQHKYSHACQTIIIPSLKHGNPSLGMIIANFPPSTSHKPSLLKRSDVECFFHEFGHALHSLLSRTTLGSFSSLLNVKIDFVEVPSQMFEQWMLDKDILRMVSHHYKTGNPIPENIVDTIIELKNLASGNYVLTQGFYALLSLGYYGGPCSDLYKYMRDLYATIPLHVQFDTDNHMYCAFGHLLGYGACYYSYLYSKVLAMDIFEHIKTYGLLNPEIGKRFSEILLRPGGSKEPAEMVKEFLGREPRQDAFLKDLGL